MDTIEQPISLEAQKNILQQAIESRVKQGYIVVSQTDTTAQLTKKKGFSCLLFTILFILGIIPGIIYLLVRKDKSIYITVDEYGRIKER